MSSNTETALGARGDWWGDTDESNRDPAEGTTPKERNRDWGTHHRFKSPQDRDAIVAFDLLRKSGTILCGEQLHIPSWQGGDLAEAIALVLDDDPDFDGYGDSLPISYENKQVELTEPSIRPPSEMVGEQRHRKRYNPETGAISGTKLGTWCELKDRPAKELFDIVETAIEIYDPLPGETDGALEIAKRLKHDPGGPNDHAIMTAVVRYLRRPEVDVSEAVSYGHHQ